MRSFLDFGPSRTWCVVSMEGSLSVSCQAEAAGAGGGRRGAGSERRAAAETQSEEEVGRPEERATHQGPDRGRWGERERPAGCLQLHPGGGLRQKSDAAQGPGQGGWAVLVVKRIYVKHCFRSNNIRDWSQCLLKVQSKVKNDFQPVSEL